MPIDRFYLKEPFEVGHDVSLKDEEFHHLNRVMRKKEGDMIELVNGMGDLARANVLKIEKREAILSVIETAFHEPSLPPLILVQALPKLSHLELIIQKGTELGTSHFYIFPSERSEKQTLSENQTKRLKQICIGAMKQCGRFDLPSIEFSPNLTSLSLPNGHAFFGDLRSKNPLPKEAHPYILFIGPEKGFSDHEHQLLENLFQAQGILLHPYTLRAETAAIVALTLAASQ